MSPKIVFAALLFCCALLGYGNGGIIPSRPSDDSYISYPSTINYPSDWSSSSNPSNMIVQNPGMLGSFGSLGQNPAMIQWNWHQQSVLGGSYPQGGYTYKYEYKIPIKYTFNTCGSC